MSVSAKTAALPKVRIATTSLAGCFGCHTSFLDIDERIFELAKIAEFDRSPITDIKHCGPCDIALIEGGVCNAENVQVLRELRANAKILVAIGACAINGGLPAMRNRLDVGDILNEVYRDMDGAQSHVPNDPELPLLFDKVYPVNEIVRVDYFIPGCPPSGDAIWKYLNDLILVDSTVDLHYGRVVKRTGEGALVEFRSFVDDLRSTAQVQNAGLRA